MFVRDLEKRLSGKMRVECKYLRTRFNFPQLSLSSCLMQVLRNATVVLISHLTQDKNRSWAVVW
jgi:hypothetical protein